MNESTIEEMFPAGQTEPNKSRRWFHFWPLGLFLLILFLFDCLLSPAMSVIPRDIANGYMGVFVGHLLIASMIASLLVPSWIVGALLASLFLTLSLAAVTWGDGSYSMVLQTGKSQLWRLFWNVLPVPLFSLAGAVPLLIACYFNGWSIQSSQAPRHRARGVHLEDIFLTMMVLAAVLSLTIAPSIAMEIEREPFLLRIASFAIFVFLACLFGAVPLIWVRFCHLNSVTRLGIQLGWLFFFGILLAALYSSFLVPGGLNAFSLSSMGSIIGAFFVAILPVGFLESLRASQMHFVSAIAQPRNRAIGEEAEPLRNPIRWQHRAGATVFALIAIGAHIPARSVDRSRIAEDQWLADRYRQIEERGGEVQVAAGRIVSVAFSDPRFGIADIEQFTAPEHVSRLSLAHAQVGDEIVECLKRFPGLQSLDLSYTSVTDSMVPALCERTQLRHLAVSGTKLSAASIQLLASLPHLRELDLGDLDLDDGFCMPASWGGKPDRSLSLRGNRKITDAWAAHPENDLSRGRFGYLDFSETGITGAMFSRPVQVRRLILHGVPMTDSILAGVVANLRVTGLLSLEDTLLTDASLPILADSIPATAWSLGNGNFTDDGLATLKKLSIVRLELRGKQFTGVCFEKWSPMLYELVLTGSSISDETIGYLANISSLQSLGLAGTAITDESLAKIAKFPFLVSSIDVSDTGVTLDGLMKHIRRYTEVVVQPGQFKPEELRLLRSKMTVSVGQTVRNYRY